MDELANHGRRPRRAAGAAEALGVERLGETLEAMAGGDALEDPAHEGRLGRLDHAAHMEPLTVLATNLDVLVPVDLAAGDVPAFDLPPERVARPLAGLLSMHVVDERDRMDHELVGRAVTLDLAIGQVTEKCGRRHR
jgi:hypothetical protein